MAPINKESPINNDNFAYVIGIDFGTTFSGAGYVFIKHADRKDVIDIKKWPKNAAHHLIKIPTVIRYHNMDPKIHKCGLEALNLPHGKEKEYGPVIRLFKLHLHEETKDGIPDLPDGMTALKVISDYLRYLHKNICSEMEGALGGAGAEFEKRKTSFRYCLTVPAIWTSEAKSIMREASIIAGIIDKDDHVDRLLLVGEPEAAALYSEKMKGGISIKSGETLMIVDAGGGTIDLTTFMKTIDGETKSFKEITEGIGNTLGSARLDLNLRNYILLKMSGYPSSDEADVDKLIEHFRKQVKLSFGEEDSDETEDALFDLPYSLQRRTIQSEDGFNMSGDKLEIPIKVLAEIVFDPVIEEVINLIQYQLDKLNEKKLDYIILVGGFGQNRYLLKKIKENFEEKVGNIIVPDAGELAVSRGAVYFGLDPYSISHRRMKLSYGVSISSPFIEGLDNEKYKAKDREGKIVCKNRFDPFVKKGEDVSIKDCIRKTYFTYNSNTCHIKLYGYKGDAIPRYVYNDTEKDNDSGNVAEKVADFCLELPASQTGKPIEFTMEMYFGHMEIKIEVTLPGMSEKKIFIASYNPVASR